MFNINIIIIVGPAGVAIGIAGGALIGLLCGFLTRYCLNKAYEKYYFEDKAKLEKKMVEEALKLFFDDKDYDIDDEKKFNGKILRRTYRRLALIYHPQRPDGDLEEWYKLSSYYGILSGIWEEKTGDSIKINSCNDLNEEQRLLVLKQSINAKINEGK